MKGEIIGVWPEAQREIFSKLAKHKGAPVDLFPELYRELTKAYKVRMDVTILAGVIGVPAQARSAFMKAKSSELQGETALCSFFERAHVVLNDMSGDSLANYYFQLAESFMEKYNLRYDLRRSFSLHPTLPGIFARLIRELREVTYSDIELRPLMVEFEDSIRNLKTAQSPGNIKTCIIKQINLLEAVGRRHPDLDPNVRADTLSRICDGVGTWPHNRVKDSMKAIYTFASDYPGIRHGGRPESSLRDIDMRDLVAITIMLAGFSPYLTNLINSDTLYQGE